MTMGTKATLRSYDLIIRYGGDEFVCSYPADHTYSAEMSVRASLSLNGKSSARREYLHRSAINSRRRRLWYASTPQ